MMQWERGRVRERRDSWPGVQQFVVDPEPVEGTTDADASATDPIRALAYTELVGEIGVGERVLLNTNALRRSLGTGGDALVVARLDVLPPATPTAGHMVKARYTPVQTIVDAIDDPASPHYPAVRAATDVGSMPVVLADLHSSLPAVVAGIRLRRPDARIAYVMTDGAALPAAYSRTVATLREHELLTTCISTGQAFGGDLEAVTVHSALLGARHVVGADVTVLAQGPGNLGTGTGWGFSGMQVVEALHAAAVLGARPVAALRVSAADPRERHRGLSHHMATMFGAAALSAAALPIPLPPGTGFDAGVRAELEASVITAGRARGVHHEVVPVDPDGVLEALRALPVRLSTMGRGVDEDAASFVYAALAGRHAAELASADGMH